MSFLDTKNIIITGLTAIKCRIESNAFLVQPREFHSLSFRLSGNTELFHDNTPLLSRAGDITYVPKGVGYSQKIYEPTEIIAVHFNIANDFEAGIEVIKPENTAEMQKLFLSLYHSWQQNPVNGNINCMQLIYKILCKLYSANTELFQYKNRRILEPAVEYLREYYIKSDLSMSYLASLCGVSDAYFRRLFELSFNCSPVKHLKHLRVEHAKRLLETGFYTVAEVAERSGYTCTSYFCTDFKRETGITPKQYSSLAEV